MKASPLDLLFIQTIIQQLKVVYVDSYLIYAPLFFSWKRRDLKFTSSVWFAMIQRRFFSRLKS